MVTMTDEERLEEAYTDWKTDHMTGLETGFIELKFNTTLDDDIPDVLDDNNDEFEAYCLDRFYVESEQ